MIDLNKDTINSKIEELNSDIKRLNKEIGEMFDNGEFNYKSIENEVSLLEKQKYFLHNLLKMFN